MATQTQNRERQRRLRSQQRQPTQQLQIGQEVTRNGETRVWAGNDYGFQSRASFNRLKERGEFKVGGREIRIARQAVSDRIPQWMKDNIAAEQRRQQAGWKPDAMKGEDATSRAINAISDRTNIAPELISAAASLAESAITGRVGRTLPRGAATSAARNLPAPTARAYHRPGVGSGSAPLPAARRPIPQSPAAAERARRASARPVRGQAGKPDDPKGLVSPQGHPADARPPRASSDRARQVGRGQRELVDNPPSALKPPTGKEKEALERFFSGDGKASTFPSSKGKDRRAVSYQVDPGKEIGKGRSSGLSASDRQVIAEAFDVKDWQNGGFSVQRGANPTGQGRPGAVRAIGASIQRQREAAGLKPLGRRQLIDAVSERILAYRQRQQFNQLQAERRGGKELPTPRDARRGETAKPASDRKSPDNIPGGERIPQSRVEEARRATERANIRRAARMGRETPQPGNPPAPDARRQQRRTRPVRGTENPGAPQGGVSQRSPARTVRPTGQEQRPRRTASEARAAAGVRQDGRPQSPIRGRRTGGAAPGAGGTRPASLQNPPRNRNRGADVSAANLPAPEIPGTRVRGRGNNARSSQLNRPVGNRRGVNLTARQLERLRRQRRMRRQR